MQVQGKRWLRSRGCTRQDLQGREVQWGPTARCRTEREGRILLTLLLEGRKKVYTQIQAYVSAGGWGCLHLPCKEGSVR